jgi:Na+/proline symporter/signal transduction histidine kinase
MGINGLGILDYAIFFTALVAVLVVGLWSGGKIESLEDYAVSRGKKFSTPVLAMTLIVTMIGSNASIGAIAETYNNGIIYSIYSLLRLVGIFLFVQYAASFMVKRYPRAISLYGIIEQEYGGYSAKFASAISVLFSVAVLSVQMIGMGYVVKTFMGLPLNIGIIGSSVVFIIYSSISGIRGVVYTDVLQFFIVLIVFPILVAIIVYKVGGLESVINNVPQEKTLVLDHPDITEYFYLFLFKIMPFGALQAAVIQRVLMCGNSKEVQRMGLSWALFASVFILLVTIVALASMSLLPASVTGKEVVPTLMAGFLPIGLKGVAITAFMAVIMSSADSELNTATVLLAEISKSKKERAEQRQRACQFSMEAKLKEGEKKAKKKKESLWLIITGMLLGGLSMTLALLDLSFLKVLTISSAVASTAVNIPVFFAPFKDRGKVAVKAYLGSSMAGFIAFFIFWMILGRDKMFTVSLMATVSAIVGWFIGANFFDKTETNFWRSMRDAYAPKFNTKLLLETSRGHEYFVVFGIFTFLLRYLLEVWKPFAPGYVIISLLFSLSCLLLLALYFGEKIRARNYMLFLVVWLLTMFFSLPLYNMVALLQDPTSLINLAGLVVALLIMNVMLTWRMSILMFGLAFAISTYLNNAFFQQDIVLINFEYISLAAYLLVAGIIVTMILRKVQDNTSLEKLEYSDAMACSIAHEIKAPISNINMMFQSYSVDNKEHTDKLLRELREAQQISNEVLTRTVQLFIQGKSSDVKDEYLNLTELATELLEEKKAKLPSSFSERISIDIEPDFIVYAYKNNLLTILDNLFKNAYKHALAKDAEARLYIYSTGGQLIFHDTGNGMSMEQVLNVFDKGVSHDNTSSGFGLYYCKLEMQRIHGRIECESREGEYTKFILTFPPVLKDEK